MGAAAIIWSKYKWHIIIGFLIIAIVFFIYYQGNKAGKASSSTPEPIPLPEGVDLPNGWSAKPVVVELYQAMKGMGTNVPTVREALSNLNDAQLVAVYNEFNNQYFKDGDGDLLAWFADEGTELNFAIDKFKGLV